MCDKNRGHSEGQSYGRSRAWKTRERQLMLSEQTQELKLTASPGELKKCYQYRTTPKFNTKIIQTNLFSPITVS